MSKIKTCKLNTIDPHNYITGTLNNVVNVHKLWNSEQLLSQSFKVRSNA